MNFLKGLVDVILADDAQSFKALKSQNRDSGVCLRLLRKYGVATVSKLSDILRQNEEALEQLTKQIEIDNDTISQLSQSINLKQDLEQRLFNFKKKVVELEAECDELRAKDTINRANISQLTKELVYYKELVESKSEIISGLAIKLYKKDTMRDKSLESELAFAKASVMDMQNKLANLQKMSTRFNMETDHSAIKSISSTNSDDLQRLDTARPNKIDKFGDFTGNIKDMLGDLSEMSSSILSRSATKLRSSPILRMSSDGQQKYNNLYDASDDKFYQLLLEREARAIKVAEKFAIEILNSSQKDNGRALLNSEAELLMDKRLTSLAAQVETMKSQMEAEREKYNEIATMNEELRATCSELKKMINMSRDRIEPPLPNKIEIVYINALDIVHLDLPSTLIESKAFEFNNCSYNAEHTDNVKSSQKFDTWDDFDEPWEEFTPKKDSPTHVPESSVLPIKSCENVCTSPTAGDKANVWDQDMDCFDDV